MNLKTRQDQTIISEAFEDGGTVLRRMTSDQLSVVVVGSSDALPAGAVNVPLKMLKYALLSCLSDEVMGYCAGQITQVFCQGPSMKR